MCRTPSLTHRGLSCAPPSSQTAGSEVNSCSGVADIYLQRGSWVFRLGPATSGHLQLFDGNDLLWTTNGQTAAVEASLGSDCNIDLYTSTRQVTWSSSTSGSCCQMVLQEDRNVVLIRNGQTIWETYTASV